MWSDPKGLNNQHNINQKQTVLIYEIRTNLVFLGDIINSKEKGRNEQLQYKRK